MLQGWERSNQKPGHNEGPKADASVTEDAAASRRGWPGPGDRQDCRAAFLWVFSGLGPSRRVQPSTPTCGEKSMLGHSSADKKAPSMQDGGQAA